MASRALVRVRESGMRSKTFRPYDQDSLLLMPPSVRDWVPADSLAAFINDLVNEFDLAPFLAVHNEPRGMPPYHPALMLKALLYGYASGVTSSRKLEARLAADVGFMYLAGQSHPDHKTISSFRRRHLAAFGALFLHVLVLCQEAGLVKLGRVALDGTKVKANASRHKAMSYAHMTAREAQLAAEVRLVSAALSHARQMLLRPAHLREILTRPTAMSQFPAIVLHGFRLAWIGATTGFAKMMPSGEPSGGCGAEPRARRSPAIRWFSQAASGGSR